MIDFSKLFPRVRKGVEEELERRRASGENPDVAEVYADWCAKNFERLLDEMAFEAVPDEGPDRRKHPRVPVRLDVFYRILWTPREDEADRPVPGPVPAGTAEGVNLSAGGLCILAKERYPKCTLLELELDLPGVPEPTSAFAMVAWCREEGGLYAHGLAISHIEMPVRETLEEVILERLLNAPRVPAESEVALAARD